MADGMNGGDAEDVGGNVGASIGDNDAISSGPYGGDFATAFGDFSGTTTALAQGGFGPGMQFSGTDAVAMAQMALIGSAAIATTPGVAATAIVGASVLNNAPFGQAIMDIAHDMALGLGVAVSANPSISMYGVTIGNDAITTGAMLADPVDGSYAFTDTSGHITWVYATGNPYGYGNGTG